METLSIPARARIRQKIPTFAYGANFQKDESVLSPSVASLCYNFDFNGGALKSAVGINASETLPKEALRYWTFTHKTDGGENVFLIYLRPDGLLMYKDSNMTEFKLLSGRSFVKPVALPYRLNGEDVLIICGEDSYPHLFTGKAFRAVPNAPRVRSMALHFERLFVTDATDTTKVRFSDDLDPTDWSETAESGGFIELLDERGALNKVISFLNYVFVLRDYGISRITAYADQSEFSVQNLFTSSGKIYASSAVLCGSSIIFLAADGLYVFDGSQLTRILAPITAAIEPNDNVFGEYYEGKYYLACRMAFDDEKVGCETGDYVNNALLVYDVNDGTYSITRGLDLRFIRAVDYGGRRILFATDSQGCGELDDSGERFSVPLKKLWRMPLGDLGALDKTKVLYDVYLSSSTDATVKAITENGERQKTVKASEKPRRVRLSVTGRWLGLEIECEKSNCKITRPTLVYSQF